MKSHSSVGCASDMERPLRRDCCRWGCAAPSIPVHCGALQGHGKLAMTMLRPGQDSELRTCAYVPRAAIKDAKRFHRPCNAAASAARDCQPQAGVSEIRFTVYAAGACAQECSWRWRCCTCCFATPALHWMHCGAPREERRKCAAPCWCALQITSHSLDFHRAGRSCCRGSAHGCPS